jgi:hypothetical protein
MADRELLPFQAWMARASAAVGERWDPWPYLLYVFETMRRELQRPEGGRLIINMPPRHGKTSLVVRWFLPWLLDLVPNFRILLASYEATVAAEWGRKVRDLFLAEVDGAPLMAARLRPDQRASDNWALEEGGGMVTAGVGGAFTGRGGNLLVLSDPFKNWQEAHSPTTRRHIRHWFESTFYTRREPHGSIIVEHTPIGHLGMAAARASRQVDNDRPPRPCRGWRSPRARGGSATLPSSF